MDVRGVVGDAFGNPKVDHLVPTRCCCRCCCSTVSAIEQCQPGRDEGIFSWEGGKDHPVRVDFKQIQGVVGLGKPPKSSVFTVGQLAVAGGRLRLLVPQRTSRRTNGEANS